MERPAEIQRRKLRQDLKAKRDYARRRQGRIDCLRSIKDFSIREGFDWNDLVQNV
jgi:hypothetical protein